MLYASFKSSIRPVPASLIFMAAIFFALPVPARAQYAGIRNSFIVSPARYELRLAPGESVIRNLYITNKLGYDAEFAVTVEDVSGSKEQEEAVKYYGENRGPYSIKNYVMVEGGRLAVGNGETKVVPVMISLPAKIGLAGFYGGVFVSAVPSEGAAGEGAGRARIATRAGSLLFLRVKGEGVEKGEVKKFGLGAGRRFLWSGRPAEFDIAFENSGNVYLNPYGAIEIRDRRGRLAGHLPVEPWFVFPDSVRRRSVAWAGAPGLGIYTATLVLNHGYAVPHGTTLSFRFIAAPFRLAIFGAGALILIFAGYYAFRKSKKWQI